MFRRPPNWLLQPITARLLALLGGLTYVLRAIYVAHTTTSFLDEGLYLYKGWLFANGIYHPYQDYGVWTNHTPLAFLIPGYIQKWFGPGLPTARYFMIVLAVFTLVGLWLLARRWGGNWWAAIVVWAVALNHAEIKSFTLAITEGLVAFMVVWTLVFSLGVRRPRWQLWLAAALASILILTRINLAFLLPLLLLYLWWQYGFGEAFMAGLVALAVLAIGHALFWPDILKIWASWLPANWTPFLNAWRLPLSMRGTPTDYAEPVTFFTKFLYTLLMLRLHFLSIFGGIIVLLLWPYRRFRQWTPRLRAAIFLAVLLVVLLLAHISVAFGRGFCVSCVLLYISNFDFLGLILLAMTWRFLERELPRPRRFLVLTVSVIAILGMGFTAYEDVNPAFATAVIDRIREVRVWNILQDLFPSIQPFMLFRQAFVILVSVLVAIAFLFLVNLIARQSANPITWRRRIGFTALIVMLVAGTLLTPTVVLSKGNDFFNCEGSDVFVSYQKVGSQLREVIPAGSTIYWEGRIPVIFLYLPNVKIYPPQLNQIHSFREGGNPDGLLRFGMWNAALGHQWMKQADFILIEKASMQPWEQGILEGQGYTRILSTARPEKCRWPSIIDVYRRTAP